MKKAFVVLCLLISLPSGAYAFSSLITEFVDPGAYSGSQELYVPRFKVDREQKVDTFLAFCNVGDQEIDVDVEFHYTESQGGGFHIYSFALLPQEWKHFWVLLAEIGIENPSEGAIAVNWSSSSADPLLVKDVFNMWHNFQNGGTVPEEAYEIGLVEMMAGDGNLGCLYPGTLDPQGLFHDVAGARSAAAPLKIEVTAMAEQPDILAGETIGVYYTDGVTSPTIEIYLPRIEVDTTLYVSADGSTYYDAALTELARSPSPHALVATAGVFQNYGVGETLPFADSRTSPANSGHRLFHPRYLKNDETSTSIDVFNTSDNTVDATLIIYHPDGDSQSKLYEHQFDIPARGHKRFTSADLPGDSGEGGMELVLDQTRGNPGAPGDLIACATSGKRSVNYFIDPSKREKLVEQKIPPGVDKARIDLPIFHAHDDPHNDDFTSHTVLHLFNTTDYPISGVKIKVADWGNASCFAPDRDAKCDECPNARERVCTCMHCDDWDVNGRYHSLEYAIPPLDPREMCSINVRDLVEPRFDYHTGWLWVEWDITPYYGLGAIVGMSSDLKNDGPGQIPMSNPWEVQGTSLYYPFFEWAYLGAEIFPYFVKNSSLENLDLTLTLHVEENGQFTGVPFIDYIYTDDLDIVRTVPLRLEAYGMLRLLRLFTGSVSLNVLRMLCDRATDATPEGFLEISWDWASPTPGPTLRIPPAPMGALYGRRTKASPPQVPFWNPNMDQGVERELAYFRLERDGEGEILADTSFSLRNTHATDILSGFVDFIYDGGVQHTGSFSLKPYRGLQINVSDIIPGGSLSWSYDCTGGIRVRPDSGNILLAHATITDEHGKRMLLLSEASSRNSLYLPRAVVEKSGLVPFRETVIYLRNLTQNQMTGVQINFLRDGNPGLPEQPAPMTLDFGPYECTEILLSDHTSNFIGGIEVEWNASQGSLLGTGEVRNEFDHVLYFHPLIDREQYTERKRSFPILPVSYCDDGQENFDFWTDTFLHVLNPTQNQITLEASIWAKNDKVKTWNETLEPRTSIEFSLGERVFDPDDPDRFEPGYTLDLSWPPTGWPPTGTTPRDLVVHAVTMRKGSGIPKTSTLPGIPSNDNMLMFPYASTKFVTRIQLRNRAPDPMTVQLDWITEDGEVLLAIDEKNIEPNYGNSFVFWNEGFPPGVTYGAEGWIRLRWDGNPGDILAWGEGYVITGLDPAWGATDPLNFPLMVSEVTDFQLGPSLQIDSGDFYGELFAIDDNDPVNIYNLGSFAANDEWCCGWTGDQTVPTPGGAPLAMTYDGNYCLKAGDSMRITYNGSEGLNIYLPSRCDWNDWYNDLLYVGSDGSTYYDADLTELAQAAPRPLRVTEVNEVRPGPTTRVLEGTITGEMHNAGEEEKWLGEYVINPGNVPEWHMRESEFGQPGDPLFLTYTGDYVLKGGESLSIVFDNFRKKEIYLPSNLLPNCAPFVVYVAEDGSTYYDADLTELAQAAPSPVMLCSSSGIAPGAGLCVAGGTLSGEMFAGAGAEEVWLGEYAIHPGNSTEWHSSTPTPSLPHPRQMALSYSQDYKLKGGDKMVVTYDCQAQVNVHFPPDPWAVGLIYVATDGSTYYDAALTDLAWSPYSVNHLLVKDVIAMQNKFQYEGTVEEEAYEIALVEMMAGDGNLGYLYPGTIDPQGRFYDVAGARSAAAPLKIEVYGTNPTPYIPAGGRIKVDYTDGCTSSTIEIYLPQITAASTILYVAADGSTYYDAALTELAWSASSAARLAVMKDQGGNLNLFYYRAPAIGDMTNWDALARNPSPLARDLWVVPSANNAIGMAATDLFGDWFEALFVLKREGGSDDNLYLYNSLLSGDWTSLDATARNPSPLAQDLWVIPVGNDAVGMAAVDINSDCEKELAVLKADGGDINLYLYNSIIPGDYTYQDAFSRNPSPLARDLWVIPAGNNAIGVTAIDIDDDSRKELAILKEDGVGEISLYYYQALFAGDWTYWDALARNPSPLARDLWVIPDGDDAVGITALDMDLDGKDELAIMKQEGVVDHNLYFYNSLVPGDWEHSDAAARNPSPLARDLWVIPLGNDTIGITAVRSQ